MTDALRIFDDAECALLGALLKRLDDCCSAAHDERVTLSRLERTEQPAHSILGEIELRHDELAGVTTSVLRRKRLNLSEDRVTTIAQRSVKDSAAIGAWMTSNADLYPQYSQYIDTIETLRSELLRMILLAP